MTKFSSQIPFLVASKEISFEELLKKFNQENDTNYSEPKEILPHYRGLVRQVLEQTLN